MGKVGPTIKKMESRKANYSDYQGSKPKGNNLESVIMNAPNTTKPYAKKEVTDQMVGLLVDSNQRRTFTANR